MNMNIDESSTWTNLGPTFNANCVLGVYFISISDKIFKVSHKIET